ncbi:hypothetical protein RIF29_25352 [Crotalaria pallida]|uniref:SHSP domain-containing protein n=1 Tax=Crotalaria pallida TaxID=3830 RepID=A0AAN9ELF4_CROPI
MVKRQITPYNITQTPLRPVYENVQPKSEMKETEDTYLLHVQLPGFSKERIRITFVGSSRMLRVTGERPIDGGNKWSRFDQTYPIPENCEVERLQGKFDRGILTVTMPKKLISQVTPKAEVKTTQEKATSSSNKAVAEPKSKVGEPIGDKKGPSFPSTLKGPDLKEQKGTRKVTPTARRPNETSQKPEDDEGLSALIPSEPFRELRPQKFKDETVPKATIVAATPKQQTGKPQKGAKEIEAKTTLAMEEKEKDDKRQAEIRHKTILATVKKQLSEKDEKESVTKNEEVKEEERKPYKSRKPEIDNDHMANFKGKEIRTRRNSPKAAEPSAPKAPEKDTIIGKGIRELAASASEVVARIGEGKLNEQEKPLVANMGAAILVIVALGAYVSYKFASSDRA